MAVINGDDGDNTLVGTDGSDRIDGGDGNDTVDARSGDDRIKGGDGDDSLIAGDGTDTLRGGDGNDTLRGGGDNDELIGGDGDDLIFVDTLGSDGVNNVSAFGGRGEDTLNYGRLLDLGFEVVRIVDNDGTGQVELRNPDTGKQANINFFRIENVVPCFTPGTRIATPTGERPVEDLREGDRVITRDNGIQEIRWIGEKRLTRDELAAQPALKPVLIQAGSLGHGLPERDMLVSPNHRMLVANAETALYFEEREVLVAAKHMTARAGIDQVEALGVAYIHFMFDQHEVVLSDGTWTESFQPGDYTLKGIGDAQRAEIFELFPDMRYRAGVRGYRSARRTLKHHEAALLR